MGGPKKATASDAKFPSSRDFVRRAELLDLLAATRLSESLFLLPFLHPMTIPTKSTLQPQSTTSMSGLCLTAASPSIASIQCCT